MASLFSVTSIRSGDLAVTYSTYDERRISKASGEVTRQIGQWLLVWRRWLQNRSGGKINGGDSGFYL